MVQIGNFDFGGRTATVAQSDPRFTVDVIITLSRLNIVIPGREIAMQLVWTDPLTQTPGGMTNLNWIRARFDLATTLKDRPWNYGMFLFWEETWNPLMRSNWPGGLETLSNWFIEGTATFAGIEVKLLKTWFIANKGAWDEAWWTQMKATQATSWYTSNTLKEWAGYYYSRLLDAWHAHMHALGKKSAFNGPVGIVDNPIPGLPAGEVASGMYYFDKFLYMAPPSHLSVLKYDMLLMYQYPTCLACVLKDKNTRPVASSTQAITDLRIKFGYKGKIWWMLTSVFPINYGSEDPVIQEAEYKAVLPYADAIIMTPMANMNTDPGTTLNAPRLLAFYEKYLNLRYSCSGAPNYTCTEDVNGLYSSLIECQAACRAGGLPPEPKGNPDDILWASLAFFIMYLSKK